MQPTNEMDNEGFTFDWRNYIFYAFRDPEVRDRQGHWDTDNGHRALLIFPLAAMLTFNCLRFNTVTAVMSLIC